MGSPGGLSKEGVLEWNPEYMAREGQNDSRMNLLMAALSECLLRHFSNSIYRGQNSRVFDSTRQELSLHGDNDLWHVFVE